MFADLDDVIAFLLFFVPTCGVAAWLLARGARSSEPDDLAVDLAASGNLGAAPEPSGVVWFMAALLPQLPAEARKLEHELGQAGYYRRATRIELLAARNALLLGVLIVIGCMVAGVLDREDVVTRILLVGAGLAILIYGVPRLVVQSLGKARLLRIQRGLPDTLDLLTMCMVGGLSFQEALSRVAGAITDTQPDLSFELRVVGRQIELGSFEQAFRHLASRLDLPELKSLSAMIVQSERLGSNLVAPIGTFATDLRRDRRRQADGRATAAAVRMTLPMVLCLLPATVLLFWGPAMLEIRDFWRAEQAPLDALMSPDNFLRPDQQPGPAMPGPVENAAGR